MPFHLFSFSNAIWKRFRRNGLAMVCLVLIGLFVCIAVLCYIIAPDNTPNADLQTIELQAKPPGYQQTFLLIPLTTVKKTSWLSATIQGRPARFKYIPIQQYWIQGNQLQFQRYVDEDTSVLEKIAIQDIVGVSKQPIQTFIVQKTFWLGTDMLGRDLLSRLIIGTRTSLSVGLVAVLISLLIGIGLGSVAGYYGKWVDALIMWGVNVVWSIPTVLLVFAFTISMGKGFWQILIAIGLTMWVNVARLVRGQVMQTKSLEYVQAAQIMGLSKTSILFKHILPNISGPVVVLAASNFAMAIIIEAGLSFLGIGLQPPQPSWGLMIKENYHFIITSKPFLALIPGFAIMLLVLAFTVVGNSLRDAFHEQSN
jgi:peptide/nickel transport system permease protein